MAPVPAQRGRDEVGASAVQADDVLLDELGGAGLVRRVLLDDDVLAVLLLAWRFEVDDEVCGELVDVDTALAAIEAVHHAAR